MSVVPRWVVVLLLVTLLAGCTKDDTPPAKQVESESTVGIISGVTVSPDIQPIAGADIELIPAGVKAESDLFGRFRLEAIPPGTYTLTASATGFSDTNQTVVVEAGVTLRPRVVLPHIPDPTPSHQTHEFSGYFQASGGAGSQATDVVLGTASMNNCTCVFQMPAPASLAGVTVEAVWEDTVSGPDASQFRWNLTIDSNRSASGLGASPLLAHVYAEDIDGGFDGAASLEVSFAPDAEWPAYDQGFQVFITVWEVQAPPEEWSKAGGGT